MKHYDYVIVGSGIAGLYTALLAVKRGSVLIVTKGSIDDCNTRYAQGGIAAAIGKGDSPQSHLHDTIAAGDGLCDPEAVRILAEEAPVRIADLVDLGVPFDTMDGEISLTLEAAHSAPRILHAGGDATGEHMETTLSYLVRSSGIEVLENRLATDIIVENNTVKGIETLDCRNSAGERFGCRHLILATGGAGQLYKFSTNTDVATGDGVALAFSAGAEITDMEFFQFHPTTLHLRGVTPFLISEAVRGEGGVLRNADGRQFMSDYAPEGDLAPRDVVARSILHEAKKTGSERVFLDVTQLPPYVITTRFPHIYRFCLEHGLDITKSQIPVSPAAHYMMGGVRTNSWGETSIAGLFAVGEVACTGVHGANRLASNSLLEAVVFGRRIIKRTTDNAEALTAGKQDKDIRHTPQPRQKPGKAPPPSRAALQRLLWDKVGIIRHQKGLTKAADTLAGWQEALPPPSDLPSYEMNNLVAVGRLVTEAALLREESRGAHFRSDFPQTLPQWRRHIISVKR